MGQMEPEDVDMWVHSNTFTKLLLIANTDIPFNGGPRICIGKLLLISHLRNTS
jgi:hypothetical protein